MSYESFDYNLLNNNTFGISAECRRFVEFESVAELRDVLLGLTPADGPLLLLGGGSNLLLKGRFEGVVLHSAIKGMEVTDDGDTVLLRCGSGEVWDDVVAYAVENGFYGIENLSIIPGEVGASAVQNIGAYGVEAKDVIWKIEALEVETGCPVVFGNADCDYGYRQSKFKTEWKNKYVVTYVTYRLQKYFTPHLGYGNIMSELKRRGIDSPTAKDVREAIIDIRNQKLPDPKVQGNAGSFFMNPVVGRAKYEELASLYENMPHYDVDADNVKIPAGWLIEQCGWKGRRLGNAGVHDKQALVLVNHGGATGKDIIRLSDEIRKDVKERFGIDIFPEVNFV